MSEEQAIDFTFSSLLPIAVKMMERLTYSSILGLISFPLIALIIEKQFAIHFWIITFLDAGLLLTLLYYLRGQLSQMEREKKEFIQKNRKKSSKKKKSQENEKDKVDQKAKKESQKFNQNNLNKQQENRNTSNKENDLFLQITLQQNQLGCTHQFMLKLLYNSFNVLRFFYFKAINFF